MTIKKILYVCCIVLLSCQVTSAKTIMKSGVYRSHHEGRYFSLTPPRGFNKNESDKNGIIFINTKQKVSVGIFAYPVSEEDEDVSDDVLLKRLHNHFVQKKIVKFLNKTRNRQYEYKRFKPFSRFSVMVLEDYNNKNKKNPSKALVFYKKNKMFLISVGAQNVKSLKEFEPVFSEICRALRIK